MLTRAHACCPAGTSVGPAVPVDAQSPQPTKIWGAPGAPCTSTSTEVSTAGSGASLVMSMPTISAPGFDCQQDAPAQCTRPWATGGDAAEEGAAAGRPPPSE